MTKQDKENLQNKKFTNSLLFSCLAACEPVISKNAYLEKNGLIVDNHIMDVISMNVNYGWDTEKKYVLYYCLYIL